MYATCLIDLVNVHVFNHVSLILISCINPSDRYRTAFLPVSADERVSHPSHAKRFRVQTFAFFKNNQPVHDQVIKDVLHSLSNYSCLCLWNVQNLWFQIFLHCEAVICDVYQADSVCINSCPLAEDGSTNRGSDIYYSILYYIV